jgi:flagellar assembly factor FliW
MADLVTSSRRPSTALVDMALGEFSVRPDDLVSFPSGLPGFEQCRSFVLVSGGDLAPFSCLQAVGDLEASFLVIDPRRVLADYRCTLGHADRARLGAGESSVLLWLSVVSFGPGDQMWVNLRAPIVINPDKMLGYQVLPHNSLYPLRHPLASA